MEFSLNNKLHKYLNTARKSIVIKFYISLNPITKLIKGFRVAENKRDNYKIRFLKVIVFIINPLTDI